MLACNFAHTMMVSLHCVREEAINLGYVTPEEYDAWVKPEDMVGSLK